MLTRAWNKIDGTPVMAQEAILAAIGDSYVNAEILVKRVLGDGWRGGAIVSSDAFIALRTGPIVAELWAFPGKTSHDVLMEMLDSGGFLVRDPIDQGYTYVVDSEWVLEYVRGAVWRTR
jgi:hypothetical protein